MFFPFVYNFNGENIIESATRHFESDTMLGKVALCLALIPFEYIFKHKYTALQ